MKNIIITWILLFWCTQISFAQTWEIGLSGGITYYVGDLNPAFHFRQPHAAGSVFVKRNFGNHWSLRGGAMYGRVSADDADGVFAYQGIRNLRFQTDIYEVHGILEFNFFPYRPGDPSTKRWTPYLFIGFAGFYFNPKTLYNDVWINLQPLGTEGQQTQSNPKQAPYNLVQPAVPFGMGLKWSIAERLSLGFEWGMRILFTDYLDDVSKTYGDVSEILLIRGLTAAELSDLSSGETTIENTGFQRGNPTENDWFSYLGVSLSYNIADPVSCYSYKRKWSKRRK